MGRCGVLFVGLGGHDRGIQVQGRTLTVRAGAGLPRGGPSVPSGTREPAQLGRSQRLKGPLRAGAGWHRPEQLRLSAQGVEIGEALGPIGQRHHQLGQAHARVVTAPWRIGEHLAEPGGQPAAVGHLSQPHEPATRDEALAIAGHGPRPDQPGSVPH